jgi:hypothetical protein
MKALGEIPALRKLAAAIVWFEPPQVSLGDPVRFLAYAMTYATTQEVAVLRKHVSDRVLYAALKAAPPGIMDKRSWAYWHAMLARAPAPPMPTRSLRRARRRAP